MANSRTWNAALEASPADADNVSEGAGKIRALKVDIRERIAKDHYMDIAGTDADHGEHAKCTLRVMTNKPVAAEDKGYVYTKEIADHIELFYEREDGTESQITGGGTVGQTVIPSGTKMLFYQDTAPTGWTLLDTLDDKMVYITKGSAAGGQTGGAVHSTGTWTAPSHTHPHQHTLSVPKDGWTPSGSDSAAGDLCIATGANTGFAYIQKGTDRTLLTGMETVQGPIYADTLWRPASYSCIICTKV